MHKMIRPFILRRLKAHVETSLLPKKEIILFTGFSEMQKTWYKNLIMRNFAEMTANNVSRNMLMHLRKCCIHP